MSEAENAPANNVGQAENAVTSEPSTGNVNNQNSGGNSWIDSLPADLQNVVTSKGFKEPSDVLNSYVNLEKLRGVPQERLLKLPEKPDDPAWNDIYFKLGKPETPSGYGFEQDKGGDDRFTKWAEQTFHDLNLTSKQGKELAEKLNEFNRETMEIHQQQYNNMIAQEESKLKSEWGAAYDQNIGKAQIAAKNLGFDGELIDQLEQSMGYAGVMKFMHNLGSRMGEGKFIQGNQTMPNGMLTPDQARSRINSLKQDREWTNRYLKGDMEAKQEMEKLQKMAVGQA